MALNTSKSKEDVNLLEEVVQRAGFEPANRYGLGPHPSAFDQAGRPLQQTQGPHSRISKPRRVQMTSTVLITVNGLR